MARRQPSTEQVQATTLPEPLRAEGRELIKSTIKAAILVLQQGLVQAHTTGLGQVRLAHLCSLRLAPGRPLAMAG